MLIFSTNILIVSLLYSAVASGRSLPSSPDDIAIHRSIPNGYQYTAVTWKFLVDGEEVIFMGTVQELEAYKQSNELGSATSVPRSIIHARQNDCQGLGCKDAVCHTKDPFGVEPAACDDDAAREGYLYLGNLGPDHKCGMGPQSCGQISCGSNCAIFWCNENERYFEKDCSDFAVFADQVRSYCWWKEFSSASCSDAVYKVQGQAWDHLEGFMVELQHAIC
ncbi:putative secreted protein [Seiridium cardinale]|uniref:Secreted protein n=1 Tax=Seiridium cardinale TaxID=138064 RepID=A0ABR2XKH0_9PEZI